MPLLKKNIKRTYADYLKWEDGERWEIINGIPYNITSAPNSSHQRLSVELSRQISNYLLYKTCDIYAAPFDVRLGSKKQADNVINNVVQPDISIICDKSKIDGQGCIGPPDMIIEIVSPSNASMDYKIKFKLYEEHGVKEYWIVDPIDKIVHVYELNRKKEYGKPKVYSAEDSANIGIFDDLIIDLDLVFKE